MNNLNNTKILSNQSKVSFNIIFDSLLINNDRNLLGSSNWNLEVSVNDKTLDLLTHSKVTDNQLIKFNKKNISLVIPISGKVDVGSFGVVEKPLGKWDILDYFGEKYDLSNNFGKGNHTIYPTNGIKQTVTFNILHYNYTVLINKDPDYVLKYHIQTNLSKPSLI